MPRPSMHLTSPASPRPKFVALSPPAAASVGIGVIEALVHEKGVCKLPCPRSTGKPPSVIQQPSGGGLGVSPGGVGGRQITIDPRKRLSFICATGEVSVCFDGS